MVMEKPSAQLVGREFVRQYYTLLNQAPDYLHRYEPHLVLDSYSRVGLVLSGTNEPSVSLLRFYGKNSSYVHGGLDSNGKPVEAVYGQSVSRLHPAENSFSNVLTPTHQHTGRNYRAERKVAGLSLLLFLL